MGKTSLGFLCHVDRYPYALIVNLATMQQHKKSLKGNDYDEPANSIVVDGPSLRIPKIGNTKFHDLFEKAHRFHISFSVAASTLMTLSLGTLALRWFMLGTDTRMAILKHLQITWKLFCGITPLQIALGQGVSTSATLDNTSHTHDNAECVVCAAAQRDVVFFPCVHMVACAGCAAALPQCPICRANVVSRLKVIV